MASNSSFYVDGTPSTQAAVAPPAPAAFYADPVAAANSASQAAASASTATNAVQNAAGVATPLVNGTAAVGTSAKWAHEDHVHPTDTTRAPLASPALTGAPTAPTAPAFTNSTQLATTAYVDAKEGTAAPLVDGAATVGASHLFARQDHVHPTDTTRAPTASPTFTGTVVSNGGGIQINPTANSLTPAIAATQTFSGSYTTGELDYNSFLITSDNAAISGTNFGIGFRVTHTFGGAACSGGRQAFWGSIANNAATSATNGNRNYVGVVGSAYANATDGGTGTATSGVAKGAFFGANFTVSALNGATNLLEVAGGEVDFGIATGASAWYKVGWSIVNQNFDAVQGTAYDCSLGISSMVSAPGVKDIILIGPMSGFYPGASAGNILRTVGGTAANGIDISNTTISGSAFKSPGFTLSGGGAATLDAPQYTHVTLSTSSAGANKAFFSTDGVGNAYWDINRSTATGVFANTTATHSRIQLVSGNGSGQILFQSSSTNNVAASTIVYMQAGAGGGLLSNLGVFSLSPTVGLGYGGGSGATVTQATSRTTGVTLNNVSGQITLVSAAGTTAEQSFVVTNSTVSATDTIIVNQTSGVDRNLVFVTNVANGSFKITFWTTGGTTVEQPVFKFNVIKGSNV